MTPTDGSESRAGFQIADSEKRPPSSEIAGSATAGAEEPLARASARHTRTAWARFRVEGVSSRAASVYIAAVGVFALTSVAALAPRLAFEPPELVTFGVLFAGVALGSFLIVPTEPNHGFDTALLFITASVLLLPPELVALVGIAHACPEFLRRRPWDTQVFNVANYTLDALAAWGVAHLVNTLFMPADLRAALAVVAACLVLVSLNHLLLAIALRLARGRSFRESGLFSWKSISTDLMLASLGATFALIWATNPYLTPLVLGALVLVNRSFSLLALLRRSEGRFRAIYESSAVGIRLTDTSGRILAANQAFAQMVGCEPEKLSGRMITELVAEDDVPAHAALFGDLVAGRHESHALERQYLRADTSVGWAHVTESLVRDADGDPAFTIGIVHDVTDRRQLEERLNQAQKMEAVGRLAGGVAHDFNNLLTVISAHSGFVLGSLDAGEPVARADVDAIVQAAAKASSLTSQLLAFGRRQIRQPRVLDLNTVVLETHRLLARTLGKEIRIGLELEASLASVKADPTQIEQVLVNLAINAADAMPSGGELTIRTATVSSPVGVDAPSDASNVMLAVADTGCGMDAPTKARMFEPFFSTKKSKGTGLGLASVYGIVAQNGGLIDVESEPGRGTTVRVYLPAVERATEVTGSPLISQERSSPATVLLVDDEDLVRTAARRLLAASGYAVLEAFDAFEALEVAESHDQPIDVLLTDLVMPGMDGRQLADRLLADRPDLVVVLMSGYSDEAVTSPAAFADGVGFVHKPFTHEKLLRAVRAALGGRTAAERRALGAGTRS